MTVARSSSTKVGAVVLAAGLSTRMGANKLTADLGGKPVIAHVIDTLAEAGLPPPIVVIGHAPENVRTAIGDRRVQYINCDRFAEGMGHSLSAGISAVPSDWGAVLLCLGDMPLATAALLRSLAEAASPDMIVIPVRKGRRGHPVLWGRKFFGDLTKLQGDVGAKALIELNLAKLREIEWADGHAIFADVDDAPSLQALRHRFVGDA